MRLVLGQVPSSSLAHCHAAVVHPTVRPTSRGDVSGELRGRRESAIDSLRSVDGWGE